MSKWVGTFLRYSGWFLIGLFLITIPCAHWAALLGANVKPDLEELLPRKSRAITDLDEIRARMKSVQKLNILIRSQDPVAAKRLQVDLAEKLQAEPKEMVASVEYRIDRELKFFGDRKVLFLETEDLRKIRNYIGNRIEFEKALYNPLNIFSEIELKEPRMDFRAIETKYQGQADSYSHFPEGFYSTNDGKMRMVVIYLPPEKSGVTGIQVFKKRILEIVAAVDPKKYSSDMEILYAGGAQDVIEEFTALIDDVETSAELVFVVVTLSQILFFQSFLATAALLLALFMARFWTFGASWFLVGSLNANSAFMGAIVLGSGITFGVMLLSRYLEERRKDKKPLRAAYTSILKTARATWTAALCAGFAYGSLYFTEFEGFKQYGIMGLTGMIFCWISSVLVLPALLIQIERVIKIVKKSPGGYKPRKAWIFGPLTVLLDKYPGTVVAVSGVLTLISLVSFVKFDSEKIIEKNLANLRNKESMEKGSGFFTKYVDEIMQSPNTPVVILAHSLETAKEIADRVRKKKEADGPDSLIMAVGDIRTFVPADQPQKFKLLNEIEKLLPEKLRSRLAKADREKVEDLLRPELRKPITIEGLPELVRDKFEEKSGAVGNLVLVDPRQDSGRWSGPQLNDFVGSMRRIADEVEGRVVPVAGQITVTSDMIASILRDGPKATALSFLAVVIMILILFRQPRIAALMLSTLIIGNLWMFGWVLLTDFKINFLNFIALPITFGIGVDYGVNIFHRYLHEPSKDILKCVRETGGAVGLCSFTTIVSYSSLLIARNQSFVSFGILAVLGEVTSLVAAVVSIPALILWLERRKKNKEIELPAADPSEAPGSAHGSDLAVQTHALENKQPTPGYPRTKA
ncbi:MAG: MMPL family transporter [Bdellovibrionales bacterium]|nr:MMPL family transporter [Bdellovibrionales bacterium]